MKKVKEITHSLSEIEEMGYGVENNIIRSVDVNIIAHFGNIPCFTIVCDNICPYCNYNNIASLGFLLQAFVEFFNLDEEDGIMLSSIRNVPCRLVFNSNNKNHWGDKAIGIGHFMKDKFILFDDFTKLGMERPADNV